MVQVDNERLQKLISSMRVAVGLLKQLRSLESEMFFSDLHMQSSAKYNFIATIEAVIDMGNHIISYNRLRSPDDYADIFRVLQESNLLDEPFANELMKMARFRNRLVHIYWDVEPKELWEILQDRLDDFELFIKMLARSIEV